MRMRVLPGLLLISLMGCGSFAANRTPLDTSDASVVLDSGAPTDDAGTVDAGLPDASALDASFLGDSGPPADDAGVASMDAGVEPPDAGPADAGSPGPYAVNGPLQVSSILSARIMNGSSGFTLHIDIPAGSNPQPVVILASGLQQPATGYAPYGQRLASHGIITITRDDPGPLTNTPQVTSDIVYIVTTWLPAENSRSNSPLKGRVDLTRIGLAGHSRGGKASCLAAEGGAKGLVKAWFGIDPVDSTVLAGDAQARADIGSIGVPIAMIGGIPTACSPAADNYEVLYAAASSPAVALTGVNASHTQFQSQSSCSFCGLCTPAGSADAAVVLDYSVRYLTAFFARELLGDTSVGASFEGAGAPGDVTAGRVTIESK